MIARSRLFLLTPAITALLSAPVVARPQTQPRVGICAQVQPLLALFSHQTAPFTGSKRYRLLRLAERGQDRQVDAILRSNALLEVQINPESRVKVMRGRAEPELKQGAPSLFLVRVVNEAGITAPLKVSGPNLISDPHKDGDGRNRWLAAKILTGRTASTFPALSGAPVEYIVLSLLTADVGLREATLAFDVGQGTQDLGFRGETPLLFHCRKSRGQSIRR